MAFAIPTYELHVRPNHYHSSGTASANQNHIWIFHTSPTTPDGQWGGTPIRQMQTAASYEWWGLYDIKIDSSWNVAAEGSQNAFPIDPHNVPGDVGWETGDPVSAMHIRYTSGDLKLQHEPNFPNHLFTIVQNLSKGVWHSLVIRVILGRLDGTVSASGHPNGGMGRTRIWVDGSDTPFDSGNVNNLQRFNGVNQAKLDILEGNYSQNIQQESICSFTAGRWGKTLSEALADSSITKEGDQVANLYRGSGINLGPSTYTTLTSRQDTDFLLPPSLGGGTPPPAPSHFGPWTSSVQYNSESPPLPPPPPEQHIGPWVTSVGYNSTSFVGGVTGSLTLTAESPTTLTLTPETE